MSPFCLVGNAILVSSAIMDGGNPQHRSQQNSPASSHWATQSWIRLELGKHITTVDAPCNNKNVIRQKIPSHIGTTSFSLKSWLDNRKYCVLGKVEERPL